MPHEKSVVCSARRTGASRGMAMIKHPTLGGCAMQAVARPCACFRRKPRRFCKEAGLSLLGQQGVSQEKQA